MSSRSFKDVYTQTRLSAKNQRILQEKFQGFSSIFSASIDLFTQHWWKGFVAPWLWMLLFEVVFGVFTLVLALTAVWDLAVTQNIRTRIELNPFDTLLEAPRQEITTFIVVLLMSVIIPSIFFIAFRYWLCLKQFAILNNSEVQGVWRIPSKYLSHARKGITGYIIISLMVLPLILIGIGMIIYAYLSMIIFGIQVGDGEVPAKILEVFSNFVPLSFPVALTMVFLGILVIFSTQFVQGFVGLFEQLIIHENAGVIESIERSYRLSKQKFWPNIFRWFVFFLIISIISTGIYFVEQILSIITQFTLFATADFSTTGESKGFLLQLLEIYGISALISFIFRTVSKFLIWSLTTAFMYSAFYNFRHTVLDPIEDR